MRVSLCDTMEKYVLVLSTFANSPLYQKKKKKKKNCNSGDIRGLAEQKDVLSIIVCRYSVFLVNRQLKLQRMFRAIMVE